MHESGEMYLETVLVLGAERPEVHAVDIAQEMGLSRASVSRALDRLQSDGCLRVDEARHVFLTAKGREIAEKIYGRHCVLSDLLVSLGVARETADADACKMEHDLSDASFEAVRAFVENRRKEEKPL